MKYERAKEIVNQIVDYAKKDARENGNNECPYALGWLMACAWEWLAKLPEDDYSVQLQLSLINKKEE